MCLLREIISKKACLKVFILLASDITDSLVYIWEVILEGNPKVSPYDIEKILL